MDQFPVLKTERLVLREFRDTDAQAVFEIFSQERVTRYLNTDVMHSVEQAAKKVSGRMNLFKSGQGVRWGITLAGQEDTIIGSCGCYFLNWHWFSCEIGYELDPRYWHRGLMAEALTAMIDFGYGEYFFFPLNRIQALTCLKSAASIGLLKKLLVAFDCFIGGRCTPPHCSHLF